MLSPLRPRRHEPSAGEKTPQFTAPTVRESATEPEDHVSAWLYIAGLCVTLSGVYAVTYALEEQGFAWTIYGLTVAGFALSYGLRVRRVSVQSFQLPLIVCLCLVCFASLTSDPGAGWLAPASVLEDRFKTLQLIFVFMAMIHSFMLTTDAGVLFACVPCMTMLALVSTTSADPEVQNAFLVFVGASTFLLIHENYLRTRRTPVVGGSRRAEGRLFGRQLQLAAFCIAGSLVLANFVAVPIRAVGQTIMTPNTFTQFTPQEAKKPPDASPQVVVKERQSIELGSGPGSASDAALLRVLCDVGLYWRGATFDYYTGRSFVNRVGTDSTLARSNDVTKFSDRDAEYGSLYAGDPASTENRAGFSIPPSMFELGPSDMRGSHLVDQTFRVMGGMTSQIYGAGNVVSVQGLHARELHFNTAGSLMTQDLLGLQTAYHVTSQVADSDPAHLRKVNLRIADLPESVRTNYLQTRPDGRADNDRLRMLAKRLTKGLRNEYDQAEAIRSFIATNCKYDLYAPAPPVDRDVVEWFLFESRRGYCDKFSAALTMLCRYASIPARVTSGFLTGDLDKDGTYIVKEKHKHLWCEVFFPHVGWVPFDATDGSEDISELRTAKQPNFAAWLFSHGVLPPLMGLALLVLLGFLVKTEMIDRLRRVRRPKWRAAGRPETNLAIYLAYATACRALAARGLARKSTVTPDEFVLWIQERTQEAVPALSGHMQRLTNLHTLFLYGPDEADAQDVAAAREAAGTIVLLLARTRKARLVPKPSAA